MLGHGSRDSHCKLAVNSKQSSCRMVASLLEEQIDNPYGVVADAFTVDITRPMSDIEAYISAV